MSSNIKSNNIFYKIPLNKINKYLYKIKYIYIILFLLIIYFIYKNYFNTSNNDKDIIEPMVSGSWFKNIFKKIEYFFAGIFKKMHNLHCKILKKLYTGKAKVGPFKNIRDKVNGFNTKNVTKFCNFFDKKLKKY